MYHIIPNKYTIKYTLIVLIVIFCVWELFNICKFPDFIDIIIGFMLVLAIELIQIKEVDDIETK